MKLSQNFKQKILKRLIILIIICLLVFVCYCFNNKETIQPEKQNIIAETQPEISTDIEPNYIEDEQYTAETFVKEHEVINIAECSDDFMQKYFQELGELNQKISYEDEETQKEMKSNMLIVTSKEDNIDSYGATQTIKAPNNQYVLVYENKEKMENAKTELNSDKRILDVDNNNMYYIQSTYNSWGVEKSGLNVATDIANTKTLEDVTVAIIDTGCDIDLFESNYSNKLKGTYDVFGNTEFTDEVGHGTHIAGTIAESTPSNVKIYPIKVSKSRSIYDSDIILAINYVVYNDIADVINMSFGGYHKNESMYAAIEAANSENIICVAAAGNDNVSIYCYPACYDNTMSISACTKTLAKASFSNYNNCVTFAAPGQSILSINGTLSGTSMATPHAVAAVAIYKSYNKNYTLENIIDGLATYCTDLGETGKDEYFGYGFINLSNIVYCSCDCNNCSEILCTGCSCTSCTNCSTYNFLSDDKEVATIESEQPVTKLTYN